MDIRNRCHSRKRLQEAGSNPTFCGRFSVLFQFIRSFPDAASMPAGESVDSNLTFMPGKKSFKKLLTERGNAGKISICCGKRL